MGIIKGFTFDGVKSLDYNIGITGSAVYNAPTRDVEMISIPGRDGEYALDHGRFNNIEITYPSGYGDTSQTNFATQMSNLRNQLASRVGYKRLEDEYNPDEYRMAIYKSGLEVSPVQYSRAGQFDITFDCKPQRFLKSGETATSKARNSTINNPTLFDSHPLLQFNSNGSDGSISLGSQTLTVKSAYVGEIPLNLSASSTSVSSWNAGENVSINNIGKLETGDSFSISGATFSFMFYTQTNIYRTTKSPNGVNAQVSASARRGSVVAVSDPLSFAKGTSSTITNTATIGIYYNSSSGFFITVTMQATYNGSGTVSIKWKVEGNPSGTSIGSETISDTALTGTGTSTQNTLTGDIYIDLDIGEAYSIDSSNNVVSLNNYVNIGGELPTLPPGNTTITYSNSISNFKVTPRWYKI